MKNYNHDLENVSEACGMNRKYTDALVERMNELTKEGSKQSQVIQDFEETFTKRELAYVMVTTAIANRKREMAGELKKVLFGLVKQMHEDGKE